MIDNTGRLYLFLLDIWIGSVPFSMRRYKTSKMHKNGIKPLWNPRTQWPQHLVTANKNINSGNINMCILGVLTQGSEIVLLMT